MTFKFDVLAFPMSNKHYLKGREREYAIIRRLKKEGCWEIAQRTAGSHSPFDIIAINKETKEILLIQSKPDDISENESDSIYSKANWLNGDFKVSFEVR